MALVLAGIIVMMGFGVFVAWTGIKEMPTQAQSTAWRWFAVGWAIVTIGCWLAYLPRWLRNAVVTKTEQRRTPWMAIIGASVGILIGLIIGRLGILGPAFGVVIGAVMSGMITFVPLLMVVMLFTKKGRAIRARQLEVNRGLHG